MKLIAQQIPGTQHLFNCNPINQSGCPVGQGVPRTPGSLNFANLGDFVSGILSIAFSVIVFLAFFWLVWGSFQYIFASGDKNKLAQARGRIIWALAGLLITAVAFLIAQLAQQIIQPKGGTPIL